MRYYLIHPNENQSLIFIDVRFNNNKLRFSTGISVRSNNWDKVKQRVKRNQENYLKTNQYLDKLSGEIKAYISDVKLSQKLIEIEKIKQSIRNLIFPESNQKINNNSGDLIIMYENWIKEQENSGGKSLSRIKRYKVTKNHFINFIKEKLKGKFSIETFSSQVIQEFYNYLFINKKLQNNTANSLMIAFRMFLKDMIKQNIISPEISLEIKLLQEVDKQHIALTSDEIKMLIHHECSTKALEVAKDMFVLQMFTLQRISDFKTINSESFNLKNNTLRLYQKKTGKYIHINMQSDAIKIIKKYNFKLPFLADQYYNRLLKNLFQEVGIDEKIPIIKQIGAKRTQEYVPKYTQISSHTARRTGITELIRLGVPTKVIMQLSGHTNMSSLEKYIQLVENESLEFIKNKWEGRYDK